MANQPQYLAGPRPEIDCRKPIWIVRRDPNHPQADDSPPASPTRTPTPTAQAPAPIVNSSVSTDASLSRLGIYQQDLHKPETVPRLIHEAYFDHALDFGGQAALMLRLTKTWERWYNRAIYRNTTLETDFYHLMTEDDEDEPEPYVYMYLIQHEVPIWKAIVCGTLPRLEDEGWGDNHIQRNMKTSYAPGAYLNVIAMSREVDDAGLLTELSGRLGELGNVEKLFDLVEMYARDQDELPDDFEEERYMIDNAFTVNWVDQQALQLLPPKTRFPKYLTENNMGEKWVKSRVKDFVDWLKAARFFLNNRVITGAGIIHRCVQESGQTGGPLTQRLLDHVHNKSTNALNGLLNAILFVYFPELYRELRQYCVIETFDADHPKQQTIAEALMHIVAGTAVEVGAGTNSEPIRAGKRTKIRAHFDLALERQFDNTILERHREQLKLFKALGDTVNAYSPGQLDRNALLIDNFKRQIEDVQKRIDEQDGKISNAQREKDDAVATLLSAQTGDPKQGEAWLKLRGIMETSLHDRREQAAAVTTSLPTAFKRVANSVKPPLDDADYHSNPAVIKILKMTDCQDEDYQLPTGWTRKRQGSHGLYTFTEDLTGKEYSADPKRMLATVDRYRKVFSDAIDAPWSTSNAPDLASYSQQTRGDLMTRLRALQQDIDLNSPAVQTLSIAERRRRLEAARARLASALSLPRMPLSQASRRSSNNDMDQFRPQPPPEQSSDAATDDQAIASMMQDLMSQDDDIVMTDGNEEASAGTTASTSL